MLRTVKGTLRLRFVEREGLELHPQEWAHEKGGKHGHDQECRPPGEVEPKNGCRPLWIVHDDSPDWGIVAQRRLTRVE